MDFESFFTLVRKSIIYVEFLAAIVGSIYYKKYKHTFLKYFLIILWYTVINEFCSYIITKYNIEYLSFLGVRFLETRNVIFTMLQYNIYHLINFSFLFLVYAHFIKKINQKKIIYTLLLVYIFSFFINMLFQNYIYEMQTIPYLVASISIIACIILYFSQILNSDEILDIKNNLLFYISIGYLLYLVGNLPVRVIRNYFYELPNLIYILNISSVLSIIMNFCFIAGFIWSKKQQQ